MKMCNKTCMTEEKTHNHFHGGDSIIHLCDSRCTRAWDCWTVIKLPGDDSDPDIVHAKQKKC